jgi:Icc-related predicted phosphoesterase
MKLALFSDVHGNLSALRAVLAALERHQPLDAVCCAGDLVYWSSSYRGRTMAGKEVAIYSIRDGKIVEAWFQPADKAASDAFFADE